MAYPTLDSLYSYSKGSKMALSHVEEVYDDILPCPFLDLPRELRDDIYSLIFLWDEPVSPSREGTQIHDYLSLLRTNKFIYREIVEILYGRNTFRARASPYTFDFFNHLSSQQGDDFHYPTSKVCLGRWHLKKLSISSRDIKPVRVVELLRLLVRFPNLNWLRIVYNGSAVKDDKDDQDIIDACMELKDSMPLLENFILCKRINDSEAEDISWTLWYKPYTNWKRVKGTKDKHTWKNQNGLLREADVVAAPQT